MNIKSLIVILLLLVGPALSQEQNTRDPETLVGLAEILLSKESYQDARRLAYQVLEASPENLRARWVVAKASLTLGEFQEAQKQADELLATEPSNSDYIVLQAMIYMLQNHEDEAILLLEQAIKLGQDQVSPEQLASYTNTLVLAHHGNGDPEKALQVCLQALQDYPQDKDLHLSCSRLYREAKNYQSALEVAQQGLKANPNFPNLWASVALAEAGLGHHELSEQAYQKLYSLHPQLAEELRPVLDGLRKDDAEYRVRID